MSTGAPSSVAAAYDVTGASWERGPGRIYNHLADVVVGSSAVPLTDRVVLDVGAGTGAASRAIERRGGRAIGVDAAFGVLATGRPDRSPGVVADALALPMAARSLDGIVAAFSYNHVSQPVAALREAGRIVRPGSPVIAAVYAADDGHPVKAIVDERARQFGFAVPAWYTAFKRDVAPLLDTVDRAAAALTDAGLRGDVRHVAVPFPWLQPADLVAWRLGMARLAPWYDHLTPPVQGELRHEALAALGARPPVLVRSIIMLSAIV